MENMMTLGVITWEQWGTIVAEIIRENGYLEEINSWDDRMVIDPAGELVVLRYLPDGTLLVHEDEDPDFAEAIREMLAN